MDDFLFSISCTTCRARLKVRGAAAIGEILACPKCQSMVQVVPPPGWKPPGEPEPVDWSPTDTIQEPPATAAAQVGPPPLPKMRPPAALAEGAGGSGSAAEAGDEGAMRLSLAVSPTEVLWRKWLLLAGGPLAAAVVALGAWSMLSSRPDTPPAPPVVAAPAGPEASIAPAPAVEPSAPPAATLDRRWLPPGARLVASVRLSELAGLEEFRRAVSFCEAFWEPGIGRVLDTFGLRPEIVDRLTWASTDLAGWPDHAVVVIELAEGQDARMLRVLGEPCELELDGAACRRLKDAAWRHPFAILDPRTVVTGPEELLRKLADQRSGGLESVPIARFLDAATPDAACIVAVDLAAARESGWRLPNWQMDVWPSGRDAWHVVWDMPRGLGFTFRRGGQVFSELALLCEGETTANEVRDALATLIPAAKDALTAKVASLTDRLEAGQIAAGAADQYELLLEEGRAALAASQWEVVDETVWGRVDWGPKLTALADAAAESRSVIRTDWLAAARAGDEANHRRLLSGLSGYRKAEGHFPAGAGGAALLPPETRLSWIATMLPYYDHRDWHRELEFGYSWNSPQNRPVTSRPLETVVNPALGPSMTEAGFPVTHYVGVAGIGAGAGDLPPGHPQAGIFGFGRCCRPEDVPDGLSNTVATLGVVQRLGAWGAGGDPTVRALTKRPYVNGPDGFGSGQPDGMLMGMADGSVRFLSNDVDPEVLEQLVTVGGREDVTVASLGPRPVELPKPLPEPPATGNHQQDYPAAEGAPTGEIESQQKRPEVDVKARLAGRVAGFELPGVPLADAVELVSQMAGLPIGIDPDSLAVLGVGLEDPITLGLAEASLADVLRKVLETRGLIYLTEDDRLLVTSPEASRNELHQVRYEVADLAGTAPDAMDRFAGVVRTLVAPDTWRQAGGRGSIETDDGALMVVQTAPVRYGVLRFCERLRIARGTAVPSPPGRPAFSLAPRLERARSVLARPVTVHFHDPAPLARIAAELAAAGGTRILIDWAALATEGLGANATATLGVDGQPLSTALDDLVGALGLGWRVVDAETFQLTTRKTLAARLELEFYPAGDLLGQGMTPADLSEWVKGKVAGGTWNDAGGPGVLWFDSPSRCLVVLQSQPVHRLLEAAFSELRGGR